MIVVVGKVLLKCLWYVVLVYLILNEVWLWFLEIDGCGIV